MLLKTRLNIELKVERITLKKEHEKKDIQHVYIDSVTRWYDMDMVIFDCIVYYFEVVFSEQSYKV